MNGVQRTAPAVGPHLRTPCSLTILIAFWLFVAPRLAPYDPMQTQPDRQFEPPTTEHVLGTDHLGRDVLSRLLHGGQRTLIISLSAASLATICAVALGLLAAGKHLAAAVAAAWIRALLALPGLLIALILVTLFGSSPATLAAATGIAQIAPIARIVQASAQVAFAAPHVEAARALGATRMRVYRLHILTMMGGILAASASLAFAYSLLNSAALSYLGLGGPPGNPDWGAMLYEGRQAFRAAPWLGLAPGAAITIFIWLANRAADVLAQNRH